MKTAISFASKRKRAKNWNDNEQQMICMFETFYENRVSQVSAQPEAAASFFRNFNFSKRVKKNWLVVNRKTIRLFIIEKNVLKDD